MKKTIITIVAILCLAPVFGQGSDDAWQFSQTYYQGTAKGLGMGNALGAVGGDMTSVSINPAGMGIYRSDELTMTLGLVDNFQASNYYGNATNANKTRLSIPNVGYVWTKQRSNYRPLRYTQFGITLNRLNDFNSNTFAKGLNPTSSKINNTTFLNQLNGIHPDDLTDNIWPLWNLYLIDDHQDNEGYYYTSNVPTTVWQSQKNQFKGRSEEWAFAWSANYSDKFFIGASFGIEHIKRVGSRVFEESMPDNANRISTNFNSWNFSEELSSTGWGFNGKFGFIWHTSPWLRLGAAFHTPSIYSFNESWQTETESQINWVKNKYISPESNYEYLFIQPLKWVGSMAFVVGQSGIISLDAEYTNYGAARFKTAPDDDYDYTPNNDEIKARFGRTLNFRLGSEWRLQNSYVRFGAGYYGSPFGIGENNGSIKKASAGISVPVGNSTTFDFAYELTLGKRNFVLYDAEPSEIQDVHQSQIKNLVLGSLRIRL